MENHCAQISGEDSYYEVSINFSKQDFKSISHTVLIIILSSIFLMIKTIVVNLEPKT